MLVMTPGDPNPNPFGSKCNKIDIVTVLRNNNTDHGLHLPGERSCYALATNPCKYFNKIPLKQPSQVFCRMMYCYIILH